MHHNLKRGLSLTFSLGLLLAILSACNDTDDRVQNARTEAALAKHARAPSRPNKTAALQTSPTPVAAAETLSGELVDRAPIANSPQTSPQIDVPPPPLGLVQVKPSRSHSRNTVSTNANEFIEPSRVPTFDAPSDQSSVNPGAHILASTKRHDQRPLTYGASSSPTRQDHRPSRNTSGPRTSSRFGGVTRRGEPTEQELRAKQLIFERAALLAKQRQARLAARRYGNATRLPTRVWAHTAQTRPIPPQNTRFVSADTARAN
jgi:hypothetical protein